MIGKVANNEIGFHICKTMMNNTSKTSKISKRYDKNCRQFIQVLHDYPYIVLSVPKQQLIANLYLFVESILSVKMLNCHHLKYTCRRQNNTDHHN